MKYFYVKDNSNSELIKIPFPDYINRRGEVNVTKHNDMIIATYGEYDYENNFLQPSFCAAVSFDGNLEKWYTLESILEDDNLIYKVIDNIISSTEEFVQLRPVFYANCDMPQLA